MPEKLTLGRLKTKRFEGSDILRGNMNASDQFDVDRERLRRQYEAQFEYQSAIPQTFRKQKNALMQDLLTGKVPVDNLPEVVDRCAVYVGLFCKQSPNSMERQACQTCTAC